MDIFPSPSEKFFFIEMFSVTISVIKLSRSLSFARKLLDFYRVFIDFVAMLAGKSLQGSGE